MIYFVTCRSCTSQKDEGPALDRDYQYRDIRGRKGKTLGLGSFSPASQNYSFVSTTGKLLVGSLCLVVLSEVEKQLEEENLCFWSFHNLPKPRSTSSRRVNKRQSPLIPNIVLRKMVFSEGRDRLQVMLPRQGSRRHEKELGTLNPYRWYCPPKAAPSRTTRAPSCAT